MNNTLSILWSKFSLVHYNKVSVYAELYHYHNTTDTASPEAAGNLGGARQWENPEKNHLTHPQAELGLSHMWPEWGSNPHQTQRCDDPVIKKQRAFFKKKKTVTEQLRGFSRFRPTY